MPESTKRSTRRVRAVYEFMKAHHDEYGVQIDVSGARRGAERVLRVAARPDVEASEGGCAAAPPDWRVIPRESSRLRCTPACSSTCERPEKRAASTAWRG